MYRLEKQTEPNISVDLESTLESQSTLEFCLVRENSALLQSLQLISLHIGSHTYMLICMHVLYVYMNVYINMHLCIQRALCHGFEVLNVSCCCAARF